MMAGIANSSHDNHLKFLDSARGIAAFMVFAGHFIDHAFHDQPINKYLLLFFNGNDAVSFFFVLSGFVLSYKYVVLRKPLNVKQFWVSRFFRIYPAFFITVLLHVLFLNRQDLSLHNLKDLFVLDKTSFWEEALLLRFHNTYYFPGWTLTFEMVCSLLMPFYIVLAMKDRRLIGWLYIMLLIIGNNFAFSTHFLLGTLISCYYFSLSDGSLSKARWYPFRHLVLLVAVVFFSLRRIDVIYPLWPAYKHVAEFLSIEFFFYSGLAAFVFLVAILHFKNVQRLLQVRPLVYIGKLSFSVYLMHTLALEVVYYAIKPLLPSMSTGYEFMTLTVFYTAMTFLLSVLMHYFVELQFMAIGRKLSARVKPDLVIQP